MLWSEFESRSGLHIRYINFMGKYWSLTDEQRRARSEQVKGRKHSEEVKQKISKSLKGRHAGSADAEWWTEDRRKAFGEISKLKWNLIARTKASNRVKDQFKDEVFREKHRRSIELAITEESKLKMSRRQQLHMENTSTDCKCAAHFQYTCSKPNKLEEKLFKLLSDFSDLQTFVRFGRYEVDAYIPSLHLAFEADGHYWHDRNIEYDKKRDLYLHEKYKLIVVRLTDIDLKNE